MLKRITVENYALIDRLDLELSPGLNIITGETGAGKSILLGALGILLGARCDASAIMDSGRNCVVEGVFDIRGYGLEDFFHEQDLDYDTTTILRRVITPAGKSRAYVNDLPVQQLTLRELGSYLVDIHSQHQNLLVGQDGFRTNVLDSVAGQRDLLREYAAVYHKMRSAEKELQRLREDSQNARRDQEWLSFQVAQLEEAALRDGEQQELETERNELSNAGDIVENLSLAAELLREDEAGVLVRLKEAEQALSRIEGFYNGAGDIKTRVRSALLELRDIESELSAEASRIEADPVRLEAIDARLDTIYTLQQKHKVDTVAGLIELLEQYRMRLDAITDGDQAITDLEQKIESCRAEAQQLAGRISEGRTNAAKVISSRVEESLHSLGMPHGRFLISIERSAELRASGFDNVGFLFSANGGIEPAPLEKIASGGEMSRVMLALKSIVARSSELPTVIFDEIDTGVSGRIADAMGGIIEQLSQSMQVVNITHLPQVASKGQTHFVVYKESGEALSATRIKLLSQTERIDEIAKMLSGSTTTEAAREQARLLLGIG